MKQTKKKNRYFVYMVNTLDYGDGHVHQNKQQIGITYAVSPKQAVNNVQYSQRITNASLIQEYAYDGCRRSHLIAVQE